MRKKEKDLLKVIKQRKSSRVPFNANRPVSAAAIENILEAATWGPTAHNMQNFEIVVVNNKSVLKKLSEIKSPVSPVFVKENYKQLSFSEAELKKRRTGILANQFPPSWLTPEAQKGRLKQSAYRLGEDVRKGPVLMMILYDPHRRAPASERDFLGVMSLGFVLENMWLMATAQGLAVHIMSVFGNEPVTSETKKILGIPKSKMITLGIRIGYLTKEYDNSRLRIRRNIKDFATYNKYDK